MRENDIKSEELYAAILFADIINSSELSNILGVKEYFSLIRKFQVKMNEAINNVIEKDEKLEKDKYERYVAGDEAKVFVYFQDPEDSKSAMRAMLILCRIALEMKFRFLTSDYNLERIQENKIYVDIGVGMNFGLVAFGKVASFDNCNKRKSGSGIEGYAINLAKRIEGHSRNGKYFRIMLSENAANIIKDKVELSEPEPVNFKGISQPIIVYEIKSLILTELGTVDTEKGFKEVTPKNIGAEVLRSIKEGDESVISKADEVFNRVPISWAGNFLVIYHAQSGNISRAIEVAERLFNMDSTMILPQSFLGAIYISEGKYQRALMFNELALKSVPYCFDAQYNLALAFYHLEERTSVTSLKYFKRAENIALMDLHPNTFDLGRVNTRIANKFSELEDYGNAQARYKKAFEYFSDSEKDLSLLWKIMVERKLKTLTKKHSWTKEKPINHKKRTV